MLAALLLLAPPAPDADTLAGWGLATLEAIHAELYLPDRGLYADGPGRGPAFLWGAGVQLSALVAAARWDPARRPQLEAFSRALEAYWNPAGPTPGYDCLPLPKPMDRYYDDNVWLALSWLEAHAAFGDPTDLARAERTMTYVLSGGDDQLGGGLYWRESDRATKNTCINAPAALACLRLADLGWPALRERGLELLAWTVEHLFDPGDRLFWDHRVVADGRLVDWKFSYNAALPIRAWLAAGDLASARATADAGLSRWFDPERGLFRGPLRFDHLFAEALLELSAATGDPRYADAVFRGAATLRAIGRDEAGHYPGELSRDGSATPRLERWELLDQASAARWYLAAALHRAGGELRTTR